MKFFLSLEEIVEDPITDLIQHPDSKGAPGEEMLTTHVLPIEFLEEVPLKAAYEYAEALVREVG